MRRETVVAAASVLALAFGLAACTTTASTQVADASGAKPKKVQTYDPAFQNAFDALNNPAIGFTNVGPRGSGGFAR